MKNTSGTNVSGLVGTKLFATVSPFPANVNTQHWVDIDDETAGRRFADGFVDVTVTGVPTFTNIQVIDHILGDGAQSSTTVK